MEPRARAKSNKADIVIGLRGSGMISSVRSYGRKRGLEDDRAIRGIDGRRGSGPTDRQSSRYNGSFALSPSRGHRGARVLLV
jgi:hypothetical protein